MIDTDTVAPAGVMRQRVREMRQRARRDKSPRGAWLRGVLADGRLDLEIQYVSTYAYEVADPLGRFSESDLIAAMEGRQ
ncbi:hypothetical protein C7C45_04840 [Micromonospora arborensis]|uniref:Uncharacterized protein n=1 Tax=Micromonospora arborensis TaxID=2116518 RepID=A0A318NTH0_9ACTN|nr:hypothetical protein [Micromonospora arborensis]PYC75198.1 hypothetical protein C7C45_04840 [Micromonospora arborensis]